jgi:hypothetical protein
MIRVTIVSTRYRVRQTFYSFGIDCEETFNTMAEAEAYGRDIAEGLAQIFFQALGDYADVPYRSPFNGIGYSNEAAFFASLSDYCGAYADGDSSERLFEVRGKIKWSELVDRIFEAAITIEPCDHNLQRGGIDSILEIWLEFLDENCEWTASFVWSSD